ncbi:hypothetical protein PHLCEN_2v13152 [Hermanssonia centrifuga]|uniref:Uncharacterized protein n=1 Tax=Hermanssonia centrifuga TaxID=98765 RepID=A0A2R6NF47_9APHY|nr:hypothetical protein PHLCEN_2v13152 [Hermanssonia centrifuga]
MEDDWSGLKVGTLAHDWHPEEASHRSDEPVSNTTLKDPTGNSWGNFIKPGSQANKQRNRAERCRIATPHPSDQPQEGAFPLTIESEKPQLPSCQLRATRCPREQDNNSTHLIDGLDPNGLPSTSFLRAVHRAVFYETILLPYRFSSKSKMRWVECTTIWISARQWHVYGFGNSE